MANPHEIRGDVAAVFILRRDLSVVRCLIDAADLPLVNALGRLFIRSMAKPYVRYNTAQGKKLLHRLLMNPPAGMVVDHINHDVLDNRRCNLRIATPTENGLNRNRANKDNRSSGIRGVHWDARCRKFKARVKRNGKSFHLGLFADKEQAAAAVAAKLAEWQEVAHAS